MLEHTKKRPTNTVELTFLGPIENKDKAITMLKDLNFVSVSDSVPWEEAFPEYDEDDYPGITLAGARMKEGLTQKKLSEITGVPQGHISQMENGKRPIGVKLAKKFGKALNINYKVFL